MATGETEYSIAVGARLVSPDEADEADDKW
jgi:hypothetical protein